MLRIASVGFDNETDDPIVASDSTSPKQTRG
jgi:hypothetical protein